MSRVLFFLLLALAGAMQNSFAADTNFFTDGVQNYRDGNFPAAAKDFEKSRQAQPSVGALVNLGITQWQRGHAGAAILAWEQARWVDPFNRSATQNLEFARQVAQVGELPLKWYEVPSTWLPANDWVWLAGASLWLTLGAVILPGLFRRKKSDWQQTLAALGLGAFLFCFTANWGVVSRTHIGFILKKDAPLLLTPTSNGEVIATLTDGEPARWLRRRGNYWLVQTTDGTGWIAHEQLGLVNPE